MRFEVSPEVRAATTGNVVALESTIITHGMPYPQNLETALLVEKTVRDNGSVPATIAILDGVIKVGLSRSELEQLAQNKTASKVSRRDIAQIVSERRTGSTTVAATMIFAHMAGIRIFATGGIGGVHRGAESTWDISADLTELARTPVLVVCAGAKSILDLPRTLELLETGGVSVIGFKTKEFPAFFVPKSGLKTSATCDSEESVAKVLNTHKNLGLSSGLLLACPVPAGQAGDAAAIEKATEEAVSEATKRRISGKDITPFMLKYINEKTHGNSLKANIALICNNAAIAARVARNLSIPISAPIHVIGGICLDTIGRPEDEEISGETQTSSPGSIRSGIGGVCRNIATCINQLSPGSVSFESCIGTDQSAATISVRSEAHKNPWMKLHEINGARTAHYSAVLNGDGSLCSGIADMNIFESFIPPPVSGNHKLIVIGANISEKAIRSICVNKSGPVWIDCVSVSKAPKVVSALPYLDLVKANLDELATLAAVTPVDDPSDPTALQTWVLNTVRTCTQQYGGKTFLVTCGKFGVFLVSVTEQFSVSGKSLTVQLPDKSMLNVSDCQAEVEGIQSAVRFNSEAMTSFVDSTGGGDCLFGATAWAHAIEGLDLVKSVILGISAARMTLMSVLAVSPDISKSNMIPLLNQLRASIPAKL